MMIGTRISGVEVVTGLQRLRAEAFAEGGLGFGAEEIISTTVMHRAWSRRSEDIRRDGVWGFAHSFQDFSIESMEHWLEDIRRESYVQGKGTWTSCKVYLYPDSDGRLETFDFELFRPDNDDGIPDRPADALTLFQDLKAFPRTLDNIPQWMWTVFRAEGITPPVYNPQLKMVEWANKRLPVTETGTDFSAQPQIIDPSKEPGVFAKIGKKLFG
ncbi:hypothetical protein HAV21_10435 [Paenarthrobacter sp. MSM-2-10-13]|uniref:hypothetical protein n=1 Tax=Micrococcaceae TaxID=1268 RepID=UPI00115D9526|nr:MULTISPECIES: hypothetical protein [Micrococcaceae]NHW47304.1 hypothetical protein [Paenarthrobacter sp. MSM-2-10-13]TQS94485.1 hypothetical protein EU811_00170 [Arthrobacter sp. TS-15]BCW62000.1 hypothetical protein StoSoilB22_09730 [Arthrobacter sp. StoSoilB22]